MRAEDHRRSLQAWPTRRKPRLSARPRRRWPNGPRSSAAAKSALHEVIADYFDATEQAEKARTTAHAKAEKIRAQAHERINALHTQTENAASEHEHRANRAIKRLLELGENPKAIADTLGTPLTHVREIQRSTPQPSTTTRSTR